MKRWESPLSALLLLVCTASPSMAQEFRTFRSATGQEIQAKFEGMTGDLVKLKRSDGKVFELPKDKLSASDQAFVTEAAATAGNAAGSLNTAAGHEIVTPETFATGKAEDMAKGMKLKPESHSKYGRSWRLYAAFVKDYQLFGTMPYSVALYSNE